MWVMVAIVVRVVVPGVGCWMLLLLLMLPLTMSSG
jgi:hypothetical protein